MTDIPDEAVTVGAKAIEAEIRKYPMQRRHPWDPEVPFGATMPGLARAALEAAAPVLLAAERERIAAAAEKMADDMDWDGFMGDIVKAREHAQDLMHRVAAIARGES